jgi:hypothetical protein
MALADTLSLLVGTRQSHKSHLFSLFVSLPLPTHGPKSSNAPSHKMVFEIPSTSSFEQGSLKSAKPGLFLFPSHLFPKRPLFRLLRHWLLMSPNPLQILGNSVRGPEFASWRTTHKAACLPVSTYGLAFWAPEALEKQFKRVQTV